MIRARPNFPCSTAQLLIIGFVTTCPAWGWSDDPIDRNAAGEVVQAPDSPFTTTGGSSAKSAAGLLRPQDELYLVSTRHLGDPGCATVIPNLQVRQYDDHQGWRSSDTRQLLAALGPGTRTVVYISGNRADGSWTISAGLTFYRELVSFDPDPRPVRFILWSWPADRIRGPLRDVRAKACRTHAESYYLGWLLSQAPADGDVGLIGFSYGPRIMAGALHLLAGGNLEGRRLAQPVPYRRPVDVVMLAPAFRNDSLIPGGGYQYALNLTDRFLLLYSSCDEVLRNYRLVESCRRRDRHRIQALGYTGFFGSHGYGASPYAREQLDVCGVVGTDHAELPYLGTSQLVSLIRDVCLDAPTESAPAGPVQPGVLSAEAAE